MKREQLIASVRELLFRYYYGTLSTLEGDRPHSSLVRYSVDDYGQPLLMLSRIAQHSKNLQQSNQVSLFVVDANKERNIQECPRLSLNGTLEKLDEKQPDFTDLLQNYTNYFPETRDYFEKLDFDLYRLTVEQCHFVGGFAAAHKLSGEDFRQLNPITAQERAPIIEHMNNDHSDAIERYCNNHNIDFENEKPILVSLDAQGFHLRIGPRIARIRFPETIHDRGSARDAFVSLAQQA